jgi:DNA-binding NarL/FixJ family response regulator
MGKFADIGDRGSVNKKRLIQRRAPAAWGTEPADRLFELLSSFSNLRSSNRILVDQLRGSIGKLRHLRNTLREQQSGFARRQGDRAAHQRLLKERFGLTRREVQVALLLEQGRSNHAIARELRISAHTARHHTQRVLSKLEVHSRGEAGAKIRG